MSRPCQLSQGIHSCVLDLWPLLFGFAKRAFLVGEVALKDGCIDEQIELAIDDVGVARITIELFANRNRIGTKSAELRQITGRVRFEAIGSDFRCEVVCNAIMNDGMLG